MTATTWADVEEMPSEEYVGSVDVPISLILEISAKIGWDAMFRGTISPT